MAEYQREGNQALAVSAAPDDHYYEHGSIRSVQDGVMEEYTEKPPPPAKKRFYRQKRYWIVCFILSVIIAVVSVLLVLYVFFPMIAQGLINKSRIEVERAAIGFTPPDTGSLVARQEQYDMNSTFFLDMSTKLSNTGPFNAHISFHNPINVYYNDTLLGYVSLPNAFVSHGHGELNAVTAFDIADIPFFTAFTKDMLSAETFDWTLRGKIEVDALSRSTTIDLNKKITLQGMNSFPNVSIKSFGLPGDAPGGGIILDLGTLLVSPSPIGVELGTIAMQVGYQNVNLGVVTANNVTLKGGDNNIALNGVLVPQPNPEDLTTIGTMFSAYLNGEPSMTTAIGLSCAPNGVNPIGWLSEAFTSVVLNVELKAEAPINVIQGVSLGYLDLAFTTDAPYAPAVNGPAVVADYSIPFGFSLNITQVAQDVQLGTDEAGYFASLSIPLVPSVSDPVAKKVQFALNNTNMRALEGKESQFNEFTYTLTGSNLYTFNINGTASTATQTPIGNVILNGIKLQVPTSLHGLQFLNSTPTVVTSVDLTGGTTAGLLLSVGVTMNNPSDFSISAGDVTMAFSSAGTELGSVLLSNLTLVRGDNNLTTLTTFDPNRAPAGATLLSTFVMGQNNDVSISGFATSTPIVSLQQAFGAITLGTTLPGLPTVLLVGSKLTVYETSPTDGIVGVQVSIANPFSASMSITSVVSAVTYQGMPVGNINQDISGSPIALGGHATVLSNPLSMSMNIEPAAIALLMRQLAVASNLDTRPLDAMLGMGGLQVAGMENVTPTASLFQGFDISQYVLQAMGALSVDLQLESGLVVGDYATTLTFSQSALQVEADESVTRLIPIVGQPIVQQIVDGAVFQLETVILSNPANTNFDVQMKGSITNTGPMDAEITFPVPLTVAWQGRVLGTVAMPTITAQADVGAYFDLGAVFTVSDQTAMGDFAGYMINNADFVWDIYTERLAVKALGFQFDNINMQKFVTLSGANGFKDAVVIDSFDLPAEDSEGIIMYANTTIYNPSQVGFNLGGAAFAAYFKGTYLGPLASDGPANFAPNGPSSIRMRGHLVPQEGDGLAAVTEVFKNYIAGLDSLLTVKGVSGSGPNGEVSWLTAAFQSINIENVVLPGPDPVPELIPSITMVDMNLDFTKDPWAPPTGSNRVDAQLNSPFGFPISVTSLSMEVDAAHSGHNIAHLSIPTQSATTSPTGVITTQFSGIPFEVYDDAHDVFSSFVALLTAQQNVTFDLIGTSNALASTKIGSIQLDGVTFNVATNLAGLANLGGKSDILSLSIVGGTEEYVIVDLRISLTNPSQISIILGDVTFYVKMNEFDAEIGEVYVKGVSLVPGLNELNAQMHMFGSNQQAISQLLSNFMTAAVTPLTVIGKETSTTIEPLKAGLKTIQLASSMVGISVPLIESTDILVDTSFFAGSDVYPVATAYITNPINTHFTILSIKSEVYADLSLLGRTLVGTIDITLDPPMRVEPGETKASDQWPVTMARDFSLFNGVLTDYMLGTLRFDLYQNVTMLVGDGYHGAMYYYQLGTGNCMYLTDFTGEVILAGPCIPSANGGASVTSLSRVASAGSVAELMCRLSKETQDLYVATIGNLTCAGSATTNSTALPVPTSVEPTTTVDPSITTTVSDVPQPTEVPTEAPTEAPTQEPNPTPEPQPQPTSVEPSEPASEAAPAPPAEESAVELVLPF